jgi:hypothetical protein
LCFAHYFWARQWNFLGNLLDCFYVFTYPAYHRWSRLKHFLQYHTHLSEPGL